MTTINLKIDATQAERIVRRALDQFLEQPAGDAQAAEPAIAVNDIPPLGAYWPGEGGHNGGLFQGQGGERPYYLIVPAAPAAEFQAAWGGYSHETDDASSASDGLANTRALLDDSEEHPAAKLASKFTADGHRDFYLPARRELQVLEANVAHLFTKGYHWSSTQFSANLAYLMDFEDGWLGLNVKGTERLVRPVRRKFI